MRFALRATVVVAIILAPVAALAADWCFNAGGVGIVAQNFVKPGKGVCRPFTGHVGLDMASGTICLSSDGDTLRVGYTLHFGVATEIGRLSIPHPSLTGGTSDSLSIGTFGVATFTGPASAEVCDPPAQPVP